MLKAEMDLVEIMEQGMRRPVDTLLSKVIGETINDSQKELDDVLDRRLANEGLDQEFEVIDQDMPLFSEGEDIIEVLGLSTKNLNFYLGLDASRWS